MKTYREQVEEMDAFVLREMMKQADLDFAAKPIEYELTPEGRAIAAAYKKRQEQAK